MNAPVKEMSLDAILARENECIAVDGIHGFATSTTIYDS
jgi:hypothetical protein